MKLKTYNYTAIKNKQAIQGEIKAPDRTYALWSLQKEGYQQIKFNKAKWQLNFGFKGWQPKINQQDLAIFAKQLALMQKSGVSILTAISALINAVAKPQLQAVLINIKTDLESGMMLSQALRRHGEIFDNLFCNLIEAGELSGSLDLMLERIAIYQEKSYLLKNKLLKASYYPGAVIAIALIVTYILLVKVVPSFQTLFSSFQAELPSFTVLVLDLATFLQNYSWYLLLFFGLLAFLLRKIYLRRSGFYQAIQAWQLKLPVVGAIIFKSNLVNFTRTLATTLSSGIPFNEALTISAKASSNLIFYEAIIRFKDLVSSGSSVKQAAQQTSIFPAMVVQMLGVGEETGELDKVLMSLAAVYDQEINDSVDKLSSLLEPMIMVILGLLVGSLVIAMYLPIFQMGSLF